PSSQRYTDHGWGNSSPGTPLPSGTGMATGSNPESCGSHRCSVSTFSAAPGTRGSRTAMSSPSRYIALSVPAGRTLTTGRSAHCGNCFASNRRTSGPSIWISPGRIFGVAISAFRVNHSHAIIGEVTLFLGGDVMTGRGVDQILPYPGDPRLWERYIRDAGGY